jgi:hypothetical protein
MSVSWGSKPTPEERAANKADRAASRDAINNTRKGIQDALKTLQKTTAKEDYSVIQKICQDMLDWLKANPATNQDDINDYSTNMIQQNPLIQSMGIRKQWADAFRFFAAFTDERMKTIAKKRPELLDTANGLLTPMLAYRDTLLTWFNNGQKTLLPQQYEDKADEIKEATSGESGKEDKFKLQVFFDDTKLQKEQIESTIEDNKINIPRLIKRIISITGIIILVIMIGWGFFLGASYSTNLNIYRSFNFRLFYAIYGACFWLFVVPYEWIYKKWWLGEPLKMHGYIPLFDGPIENWSWIGQNVFSFLEKTPIVDMEG